MRRGSSWIPGQAVHRRPAGPERRTQPLVGLLAQVVAQVAGDDDRVGSRPATPEHRLEHAREGACRIDAIGFAGRIRVQVRVGDLQQVYGL